jgi:hypothetical protein
MKTPFYKCLRCGSRIFGNTRETLRFCKCGSMGVDGNYHHTRILGDLSFVQVEDQLYLKRVYKLRDKLSGLYFAGKKSFTAEGKVYTRKPDPMWGSPRKCIIETFYLLKKGELDMIME